MSQIINNILYQFSKVVDPKLVSIWEAEVNCHLKLLNGCSLAGRLAHRAEEARQFHRVRPLQERVREGSQAELREQAGRQ